jgi:uncharacterized protein
MQVLVALAVAAVAGKVAERLDLPGGLLVGAMVGAAAVGLAWSGDVRIPRPLEDASLIVIGAAIGLLVTPETLASLRRYVVPAILAGVLIIVAGLAITYLLRALGIAPPGDVLATSPGALSSIAAVAASTGVGPVEVAMFHTVRLVLVILSIPLVSRLL